jgi:allantoin racemase
MKLWYQSMTNLEGWPSYKRTLQGILDKVKEPGTTIEVHGMTKIGGIGDQFRYLEFMETIELFENLHRAIDEGFDGFLIGNIGEPGLRAAREVADFPVLGLCEAASHMACIMGGSFSFVTINDKYTPRIVENVVGYGLKERLVGAHKMNITRLLDLDQGFEDAAARKRIQNDFEVAAEAGISAGSEIIIPAGGVVMALMAHWGLYKTASGVPILNGITNLVKMGEMAVRMKQLTGEFTSRRRVYARPPVEQIAELRKSYGDYIYPSVPNPK